MAQTCGGEKRQNVPLKLSLTDRIKIDLNGGQRDAAGLRLEFSTGGVAVTKHDFKLHTLETAPEGSRKSISDVKQKYGRVPNFYAIAAESPAAIQAYAALADIFQATELNATEQNIVILTASVENKCDYCVAAHSRGAKMAGVREDVIKAIADRAPLADQKTEALHRFVTLLVDRRGWLPDDEVQAFLAAGYTKSQLLDVMVGISMKTLSNYINHLSDPPMA
ncbi:MAG: carboxymuconolactone decarboxylase family protein [Pseudolabrys sp.]|nr:carboxymuconolactone decarboxylase family protein [Pseudolabrys sp.]